MSGRARDVRPERPVRAGHRRRHPPPPAARVRPPSPAGPGTGPEATRAAGIAIENARLFDRTRASAERFQRMLLPTLPDLEPFAAAAVYRPATAPGHHLGGDWYDALRLPDGSCAAIIGDVLGHGLAAAAAMAEIRNMLRALLYDRRTPPSLVLARLDHTLHAITEAPVTTACLARLETEGDGWRLHWSTAGHLPPLVVADGGAPATWTPNRVCPWGWTTRCRAPTTSAGCWTATRS